MAYVDKQGREWDEFDIETLSPQSQQAYSAYRNAMKAAQVQREAFEKIANRELGMAVTWGYKFGKLSFTADGKPSKPQSKTPKMSLADFLAKQKANGHTA